jgi:hypothetical protein
VLLDEYPVLKDNADIVHQAGLLSELLEKLDTKKVQIDHSQVASIDDSIDLLELVTTRVTVFDEVLKKSEWGSANFARIKKQWLRDWSRNHGA